MPGHEWLLQTPAEKEFLVAGHPTPVKANIIRLLKTVDEPKNERFFIRFLFGTMDNGVFEPAMRDDGLVIGGPNYNDLMASNLDRTSEVEVLKLCASVCKWDGGVRTIEPTLTPPPSP